VTHGQLLALGMSRDAIKGAVARGALIRRHRGVYAVGHLSLPPFADEIAAVLAIGGGAIVSHQPAGALWGIHRDWVGDVHITVVERKIPSRKGIVVHCVNTLDPRDTTHRHGIPVTTVARTLIDLAAVLDDRDFEQAFDQALAHKLVTLPRLEAAIARAPNARGIARLRTLIDAERGGVSRSWAERRLLELIREAGLPEPERNVKLGDWTVDMLWREQNLVVEVDGIQFHGTRWRIERDSRKDAYLASQKLNVLRIIPRVVKSRPRVAVARVARWLGPG